LSRNTPLSLSLAQELERRHAERPSPVAVQLAYLYEAGRDHLRAAQFTYLSAQNAGKVFAHQDAIAFANRGLRLVAALPDAPARAAIELELQTLLGLQIQVTQGYGVPNARQAYSRALRLCRPDGPLSQRFPVVWGLWLCNKVASNLPRAQLLADELLSLARQQEDPGLALQAHQALGMTAFCRGQLTASLSNVEQAVTLYNPLIHGEYASSFGQDPSVMCRSYGSVVLWLLGFPDSAREQSQVTLQLSVGLSPTTQAVAWHFAAMLSQLLRESRNARLQAERSAAIAIEHGLSFWRAGAEVLIGWATAMQGARAEGIARLQAGLKKWRATGSVTYETYYLGLLSELLLADGQCEAVARTLDEALVLVQRTDERFYVAELYRLRAEAGFRLAAGRRRPEQREPDRGETDRGEPDTREPEAAHANEDLRQALAAASQHDARALELRALATQLKWLPSAESRAALARGIRSFPEGIETEDLRHARHLVRGE